jgi:hypothetical protein
MEENHPIVTELDGITGFLVGDDGERQVRYWVASERRQPGASLEKVSEAVVQLALFDAPVRTDIPQEPLF